MAIDGQVVAFGSNGPESRPGKNEWLPDDRQSDPPPGKRGLEPGEVLVIRIEDAFVPSAVNGCDIVSIDFAAIKS